MTTNNKIIQRTTPITHPAMIPTGEPSSSLPVCASGVLITVLVTDVIIPLALDTAEVAEVAVLVSVVNTIVVM